MKYLVWLLFCATVFGQVAKDANEAYQSKEGRGRVAAGLTGEGRDARQKPKELIAALGIQPGMTVADVGTGAGYMLPYLSDAVGPTGTVYAQDIFADFLARAKKNAAGKANIRYVQGNEKSTELPADTMDLILVLDAYHHFDHPESMLASLRKALKPGGRLVVVDYHKNEKSMANGRAMKHIRATSDEFVKEIESNQFRAVEVRDFLPDVQWMGIFTPAS